SAMKRTLWSMTVTPFQPISSTSTAYELVQKCYPCPQNNLLPMSPFGQPVRLSARSSYVKFTDEIEQALSSQRHLDKLNCPVIVAYGTFETPEFQRQSRDFAAALKAANKPVQLFVAEGYNHFEIIETLASPYGVLGRAVLEQMKLT
ncbi:MAG TPA: hypothetical protein VKF36_19355, partial [Syntrophorhabdales bacterium]|nr:hypothetical protein [Syntrophorhabdales bacterium]